MVSLHSLKHTQKEKPAPMLTVFQDDVSRTSMCPFPISSMLTLLIIVDIETCGASSAYLKQCSLCFKIDFHSGLLIHLALAIVVHGRLVVRPYTYNSAAYLYDMLPRSFRHTGRQNRIQPAFALLLSVLLYRYIAWSLTTFIPASASQQVIG
jgi:hypothetical protein